MVVEDNAPAHNNQYADQVRLQFGVRRLVHPPYSPETNPVEGIWASLKDYVTRFPERTTTYQGMWEVVLEAYQQVPLSEIRNRVQALEETRADIERAGGKPTGR